MHQRGNSEQWTRRGLVQSGLAGLIGMSMPRLLELQAGSGSAAGKKSLIFVELAGGPTQFETYDPKPNAPIEYRGAFEPIATNIPGVQFSEWMPEQARIADKLCVVRSVHHGHNSHDPSSHLSQTGYYKTGPKGGPNQFPCIGSVISHLHGPNSRALPAYVAVPSVMRNGRAAYLGQSCNPFEAGGDPNSDKFEVRNLQLAGDLSVDRLNDRRNLLTSLDTGQPLEDPGGAAEAIADFSRQAFELVHGSRARDAFDISRESSSMRDRYGRNTVGQSMLLARRLVQAGVTCVTVRSTGWDDHNKIADRLKEHAPPFDTGVAALVEDLHEQGLDKEVLVIAMGEFGRTPRVNKNAGRDHWGSVMSVMLACGGLTPAIVGASNSRGEVPADSAYRPENVLAMAYRHLGIDPALTLLDHSGRPRFLLEDRRLIKELL